MPEESEITLEPGSRYVNTPAYRKPEEGLFWGTWEAVHFPPRGDDEFYELKRNEYTRFDLIANRFYGNPRLWWVICKANNISNFLELADIDSQPAKTPIVYSSQGFPVFEALAIETGPNRNTGHPGGLIIGVDEDELKVYVGLELDHIQNDDPAPNEIFTGLSPYPSDVDEFWGNISSQYIEINWVSTYLLEPEFGGLRDAPLPRKSTHQFWGGKDVGKRILRIPSQTHISEKLG